MFSGKSQKCWRKQKDQFVFPELCGGKTNLNLKCHGTAAYNEWAKTCSLTHRGVPLHAEQTKLNRRSFWVPTNSLKQDLMLWYFPIPIVPPLFTPSAAFHSLSWWLLSVFQEPSDSSLVDVGPWYFTDVCACVCVFVCGSGSTPVSTDLFLDLRAGLSDEESSWNVAAGFTSSQQLQAWDKCMHLLVHTCMDVLLSLPNSIQKQDPTRLHLLTKAIFWKSHRILHKSPIAPL